MSNGEVAKILREWAWRIDREMREDLQLDEDQRKGALMDLAQALLELGGYKMKRVPPGHADREGAGE